MLTWLRRIASCFFVTLAILSSAMWVRSYFHYDHIIKQAWGPLASPNATRFTSAGGAISFVKRTSPSTVYGEVRWALGYAPARRNPLPSAVPPNIAAKYAPNVFGFRWLHDTLRDGGSQTSIRVPYLSLVLTTALLGIAIRPKPRFKFGLRDLLTLTTVAALAIGPLAFWLRSIG